MPFLIKLLISNALIVACVLVGKKFPTLGGLIATMPLTSLIVLVWLYSDNPSNITLLTDFTFGVLWGIIPTILFFLTVFVCLRKELSFFVALSTGFGLWLAGAIVHQWLIGSR